MASGSGEGARDKCERLFCSCGHGTVSALSGVHEKSCLWELLCCARIDRSTRLQATHAPMPLIYRHLYASSESFIIIRTLPVGYFNLWASTWHVCTGWSGKAPPQLIGACRLKHSRHSRLNHHSRHSRRLCFPPGLRQAVKELPLPVPCSPCNLRYQGERLLWGDSPHPQCSRWLHQFWARGGSPRARGRGKPGWRRVKGMNLGNTPRLHKGPAVVLHSKQPPAHKRIRGSPRDRSKGRSKGRGRA